MLDVIFAMRRKEGVEREGGRAATRHAPISSRKTNWELTFLPSFRRKD